MSKEAVAKVVQRAISDGAFRRQLSNDPTGALRGFDLTPAETAAIRSGDSGRLTAFGVDLRMSKAFTLFGSDSGSQVVTSDMGAGSAGALITGDGATGSGALVSGDGAMGSGALVSGDGATGSGVLISDGSLADSALVADGTASSDPMIASGNELGRAGVFLPGDAAHPFGAVTGTDAGSDAVIVSDGSSAASMTNVAPEGYATDEGQLTNDSPLADASGADNPISTGDTDVE